MAKSPRDISWLGLEELKVLLVQALEENARLKAENLELREEIARLKGLKGRPKLRPSGMEQASEARDKSGRRKGRRGGKRSKLSISKTRIVKPDSVPEGARFKGYEDFIVQDIIIRPHTVLYRRERWLLPSGETVVAALPKEAASHFGPELRRFVLSQYHQGQVRARGEINASPGLSLCPSAALRKGLHTSVCAPSRALRTNKNPAPSDAFISPRALTIPRLFSQLRDLGIDISRRQIVRLLNEKQDAFREEASEVLRTGLAAASWITVDDTGARHKAKNGYCTHIGNGHFAWFATTTSKSRINFLELLRAGRKDYVINAAALDYMRDHKLPKATISLLTADTEQRFADEKAYLAYLNKLGLDKLKVNPDPVRIATEAALWGVITDEGHFDGTLVVSDGAGQFRLAGHALCWVHAERLIHKLDTFCEAHARAKKRIRGRIWWFYDDLKAYRQAPDARRARELSRRFDSIFSTITGFATLDRLLERLRARKKELLAVLERPEIPLHTNGSENDIRCQVTRRKISGGTRSDEGRDNRDAFLSLMKTCAKQMISFWDYPGARLDIPGAAHIPPLPQLIRQAAPT